MAIEGQLQDVGLADICQLLAMGRKTGCLTVTDRHNFGYVYFKEGRVVYATVLNRPDRLGELLVRNDVISREELSAAMETQVRHPGKRVGQILVERGSVTEAQLHHFLTIRIEEAVYHLFGWNEGSFHFDPDQEPDDDAALHVSINAESLLLEGARRVDELSLIQKKLPSGDIILGVERLPEEGDDVSLTPEQERLLRLVDGERTVEELAEDSGLGEFVVSKALYGLLQAGFVKRVGHREATGDPAEAPGVQHRMNLGNAFYRAGMLEDAEREFLGALEVDPGASGARSRLALIALRSERPHDALEHLDALAERTNGSVSLLRNRAFALETLGRYAEALTAVERAMELSPDDENLVLARGILLFKDRQAVRALESFRRYRGALEPERRPAPIYFAYVVLAAAVAGEMEEALHLGREGLTAYPGNGPILVNLGVVLERRGETEAAEALYLRAVGESPPVPQAHKNLGDLAYRRGDQAGSRAHYERALKLEPELGDDLYLKLGTLAYKEGDRDSALRLWRKALELNPGNEVVRTNLDLISATPGR